MLISLVLLAQVANPAPAPTPAPRAPVQFKAPPPTPVPAVTLGAEEAPRPRTLADVARERKLDRARKTGSFSVNSGGPPAVAIGPAGEKAESTGPGSPAATKTAEALWHSRFIKLRDGLATARAALAAAEAANPPIYNTSGHLLVMAETQRNATIAPYKASLAALEAQMAQLPEDCRKAGCLPGWIRDY